MWWLDGWGISGEVGRINKWGINGRRDKCAVNGPLPAIPTPSRGEAGDEDRLVELHCTDDDDQSLQPENPTTYCKKFTKSDRNLELINRS